MDVGSLAEWVNGIATLLATGAASFGGFVAYRAYRRDKNKDRQANASVVHAWLAWDRRECSDGRRLVLVNAGMSLIYDVRVQLRMKGVERVAPGRGKSWQILPSGTYVIQEDPDYGWTFPEPVTDSSEYRPYTRSDKDIVTCVEFTDAQGFQWHRDRAGDLREVTT